MQLVDAKTMLNHLNISKEQFVALCNKNNVAYFDDTDTITKNGAYVIYNVKGEQNK